MASGTFGLYHRVSDMATLVTRLFRRAGRLLIPLSILLTLAAVFTLMLKVAEQRRVSEVETPAPVRLPLVVFTPEGAELLRYGELDNYRKTHRDFSFLAPEGQDEMLNQKLASFYMRKFPTGRAVPMFEARGISPGRQSLKVGLYGDGDTVVWYEVTDKEVRPLRYMETGPLFGLFPFVWSLLISGVLWGVGYGLWRIRRDATGT